MSMGWRWRTYLQHKMFLPTYTPRYLNWIHKSFIYKHQHHQKSTFCYKHEITNTSATPCLYNANTIPGNEWLLCFPQVSRGNRARDPEKRQQRVVSVAISNRLTPSPQASRTTASLLWEREANHTAININSLHTLAQCQHLPTLPYLI